MIGKHNLYFNNEIVGTVLISKEGMFYKIHCKYKQFDDKLYCLYHSGFGNHLGVCPPNVTLRVKMKELKDGKFSLILKSHSNHDRVYRLCDARVEYILQNLTRLRIKETECGIGVVIKAQAQG